MATGSVIAQMLKAVYDAVKASHASVRVLGGAAHSIPVGYPEDAVRGRRTRFDGYRRASLHDGIRGPRQAARHPEDGDGGQQKPIIVTEFLTEIDSVRDTASYLVKAASQLAVAGVAEADWYALQQEGTPDNIWYKTLAC